jgi:DNA (cytosine-5)-methyltransferase 1
MMKNKKFIDAYAGIGGFHSAASELGGDCLYAIEHLDSLRKIYQSTFDLDESHLIKDFRKFAMEKSGIESDWFFAGFPCQPFSKAGSRRGFKDPGNGDHFTFITAFLKKNNIKNLILENVPNLLEHDNGFSIKRIRKNLKLLGYNIVFLDILSPCDFGIPLQRKRLFIVASKERTTQLVPRQIDYRDIFSLNQDILNDNYKTDSVRNQLIDKTFSLLKDYKDTPVVKPFWLDETRYDSQSGNYHCTMSNIPPPKYINQIPSWKQRILDRNRSFIQVHGIPFENIMPFFDFPLSHRKIEYNCMDFSYKKDGKVVQFRPSGIRISDSWKLPTLVLSETQYPFIYNKKRKEFVRPSIELIMKYNGNTLIYDKISESSTVKKALGNTVNSLVVKNLLESFYES